MQVWEVTPDFHMMAIEESNKLSSIKSTYICAVPKT